LGGGQGNDSHTSGHERREQHRYTTCWAQPPLRRRVRHSDVLQGSEGNGGNEPGLQEYRGGCAAVAGIWHHEGDRGRPAAHLVWEWSTRGRPWIPAFAALP